MRLEQSKNESISPWETIIPHVTGTKSFYTRENEHKELLEQVDDRVDGTFSQYSAAKAENEKSYLYYILAVWQIVQDKIKTNNALTQERFKKARQKSIEEGLKRKMQGASDERRVIRPEIEVKEVIRAVRPEDNLIIICKERFPKPRVARSSRARDTTQYLVE